MGNINIHKGVATGRALGILDNLDHFRQSFVSQYQDVTNVNSITHNFNI